MGSFHVKSPRFCKVTSRISMKLGVFVVRTYGAYHSYQFLAPYTTWFLIYDHKYFDYFMKN